MKKDTLWRLVRVLVILVGIGVLAYPSLSEYLAERNSSRVTSSYDDTVARAEQARLDQLLAGAGIQPPAGGRQCRAGSAQR